MIPLHSKSLKSLFLLLEKLFVAHADKPSTKTFCGLTISYHLHVDECV